LDYFEKKCGVHLHRCRGMSSGGNCQRQNYGRRSIHRRRNNNNRRMPDDAVIKIKLIGLPARALAAESFEGDDCTAVGVFCALLHIMHCLFCTLSLPLPRRSFPSPFTPFSPILLSERVCIIREYVDILYVIMCTGNPLLLSSSLGTILAPRASRNHWYVHAILIIILISLRENISLAMCQKCTKDWKYESQ